MKTCLKCGKTYQDQDSFCMQCGGRLLESISIPSQPDSSTAPVVNIAVASALNSQYPNQVAAAPNPSPINSQSPNQQVPPVTYQPPVQPALYCPNCKRPIPTASQICCYCGTNLYHYNPTQPQYPINYPKNPATYGNAPIAIKQSPSTNVVGIISCLLCLVFLLAPFFKTFKISNKSGKEVGFSVFELTFSDDLSSSDRYMDQYIEQHWSGTHDALSKLFGYVGIALYATAVITYFFVVRYLASKNTYRFWDILQLCSVFGAFATACFVGVYLVNKNALKDYLKWSKLSMNPTPFFFVVVAMIVTILILAGGMRHREESD